MPTYYDLIITSIKFDVDPYFNNLVDNFRELCPGPAGHHPSLRFKLKVVCLEEFRSLVGARLKLEKISPLEAFL